MGAALAVPRSLGSVFRAGRRKSEASAGAVLSTFPGGGIFLSRSMSAAATCADAERRARARFSAACSLEGDSIAVQLIKVPGVPFPFEVGSFVFSRSGPSRYLPFGASPPAVSSPRNPDEMLLSGQNCLALEVPRLPFCSALLFPAFRLLEFL